MYLYIISKGAWHSRFPGLPGALDSKQKGGRPMPRIAVVDDQPDMRQQLCSMIDQYSRENNCMLEVTAFSDGAQVITNYCKGFDIIFLDVEMKRLNGMETAQRIRELDDDVLLIFITNMAQYAIKGYSVGALDYVLKPVPYFAFSQQLQKVEAQLRRRTRHYLAVPVEGGLRRLDTSRIYYIESEGHRVHFYTEEGDFAAPGALKALEEKLAERCKLAKGRPCVDFKVVDVNGKEGMFSDYVKPGKYNMLEVWALWCGHCRVVIPH